MSKCKGVDKEMLTYEYTPTRLIYTIELFFDDEDYYFKSNTESYFNFQNKIIHEIKRKYHEIPSGYLPGQLEIRFEINKNKLPGIHYQEMIDIIQNSVETQLRLEEDFMVKIHHISMNVTITEYGKYKTGDDDSLT